MPWTAADAESHTKKADTPAKQKTWAKIATKERKRCMDEGGDGKECDARAIRVANEAVANIKESDMAYRAYFTSGSATVEVNAVDVDGQAVPVAELVDAYQEQRGQGQGQGGEPQGDGGAGKCVCPDCGREVPHEKGTPCNEMECPDCGVALTGKGKAEEMGEQDGDKKDWKLSKSNIRELIRMIDAELGRRKKKKEQSEAGLTLYEMVPISDDMPLEQLTAALFNSCPSRVGKTFSQWVSSVRSWVKSAGTKSLTGYRRRLVMVGTKMGMEFSSGESAQVDIDKVRGLLREALTMLDAPAEIEEAELCESAILDTFMPEGDHSATILEVVKEAGITPGDGRRAPVVVDLQIIKPGPGNKKDGHYYLPETLKKYGYVFEGSDIFVTDHKPNERGEKTKVGRVRECPSRFTQEGALIGRSVVYDPDMAEKIRNRADAGELQTLTCSIFGSGDVRDGKIDGKKYGIVESINPNPLVEFVSRAGAGGHAVALAESNIGGVNMEKDKLEQLLSESGLPQDVQERLAGGEYENEEAVKTAILKEQAQQAPQNLAESEVEKLVEGTNLPAFVKAALKVGEYTDEDALKEAIDGAIQEVKAISGSGKVFGQGGGTAAQDQPLSERDKTIRFNKRMTAHGGRPVPVPAE